MNIVCYAILEYGGKQYRIKDPTEFKEGEDIEEWKHVRHFDWEENNYSCDCNKAIFIQRQIDKNFTIPNQVDNKEYEDGTGLGGGDNVTCGNNIKLIKLEFIGE